MVYIFRQTLSIEDVYGTNINRKTHKKRVMKDVISLKKIKVLKNSCLTYFRHWRRRKILQHIVTNMIKAVYYTEKGVGPRRGEIGPVDFEQVFHSKIIKIKDVKIFLVCSDIPIG